MTAKRVPAPPPQIPGFTYVRQLGSGGFSDVYLFEQDRPRRTVAVKVLFADVTTQQSRQAFESEANLMAQLSSHPNIVTIYQADVTADGRSYLVMEYCSRPSLDVRYRQGPLRVDETLALGIHIASAVETAHRAGIVHRDIKPANILTTAYNRPALTDFGISGTIGMNTDEVGMSIPWSAPEAFAGPGANGVLLDVYSLGATVYTLLAGHSPFVRPGGDNTQNKLIHRITNAPLEPLMRNDVPDSLNRALAVAMSKSPTSRFATAADFARSLQRIQAELGLAVTPIEVLDDAADHPLEWGESEGPDDAPATRVRSVRSIDPGTATQAGASEARLAGLATEPASTPRPRADQAISAHDSAFGHPSESGDAEPRVAHRQRFPVLLVAAAVLFVVVGAAVVLNLLTRSEERDPSLGQLEKPPADAVAPADTVPPVTGFKHSTVGDTVTFTWVNPKPEDGDFYLWASVTATEEGADRRTTSPSATLERRENEQTCIQVITVRDDGRTSDPARECASSE